jgi:subtilase family serine protease
VEIRKTFRRQLLLAVTILIGIALHSAARAEVLLPAVANARAQDLGALSELAVSEPISITIALGLPNLGDAEELLQQINTPRSAQFHQFLSPDEFAARFAPTDESVAGIVAGLESHGLSAERIRPTMLRVTGSPADMERTFAVSLHRFAVPARDDVPGYTFHAPLAGARLPAELAGRVAGVFGLDSRPSMRPHYFAAADKIVRPAPGVVLGPTGNPMGSLTVVDFANQYDLLPLYRQGLLGTGKTIGIMTFASFTPTDAFAYWDALGIPVDTNRLSIINVDGGPGAPSDAAGSEETTLDVEQSGGLAPKSSIMVYQAPNTSQGFVDLVAEAVGDGLADSLSISWGEWEWIENLANAPVSDPDSGNTVGVTQAVHELLVQAAIQGQSVFTSAGDDGAYEANGDFDCFGPYSPAVPKSCSLTLSVDYPASDPAITAAGGTTLPGKQTFCLDQACTQTYSVTVAHEQVWGWQYLEGWCAARGTPDPVGCGIFGVGGGGGVSVMFGVPAYQVGLRGVVASQPRQAFQAGEYLVQNDGVPATYALPSPYKGRNVPDISFNADPNTGYSVYYTSSKAGSSLAIETFVGGTSFVAPQLNGVSALLGEYVGGKRLGLLNNALYSVAPRARARGVSGTPLHSIQYGNNWSYFGRIGYSPAAGLGTMDVAQFAQYLYARY